MERQPGEAEAIGPGISEAKPKRRLPHPNDRGGDDYANARAEKVHTAPRQPRRRRRPFRAAAAAGVVNPTVKVTLANGDGTSESYRQGRAGLLRGPRRRIL